MKSIDNKLNNKKEKMIEGFCKDCNIETTMFYINTLKSKSLKNGFRWVDAYKCSICGWVKLIKNSYLQNNNNKKI